MPDGREKPLTAGDMLRRVGQADRLLGPLWQERHELVGYRPWGAALSQFDRLSVRIAVMARRSYGKSTMLNALLGRELLFTSRRQANSFPIHIGTGVTDSAEVVFDDGRRECLASVDLEHMKEATAQFERARQVNPRIRGAQRLNLSLGGWTLPPELTLIDLAGFDDSFEESVNSDSTEVRAEAETVDVAAARRWREEVLEQCDAVIFVLRPKVFLGDLERRALTAIFKAKGPGGVIPVFNIEVYETGDDTEIREAAKLAANDLCVDDARERYRRFLRSIHIDPDTAIEPIPIAALPAMQRPQAGDFGLADLRTLLAAFCQPGSLRLAFARNFAAGRALRRSYDLLVSVHEARALYESVLEANRALKRDAAAAARRRLKKCEDLAASSVRDLCNVYRRRSEKAFERWLDSHWSWWDFVPQLRTALDKAAADAIAVEVADCVNAASSAFKSHGEPSPRLRQAMQRIYAPRSHSCSVFRPNITIWDKLWDNLSAKRQAAKDSQIRDFHLEMDMTTQEWAERVDRVCSAFENHAPPLPQPQPLELPSPGTELDADELAAATVELRLALAWQEPFFQLGASEQKMVTVTADS